MAHPEHQRSGTGRRPCLELTGAVLDDHLVNSQLLDAPISRLHNVLPPDRPASQVIEASW